MSSETTVVAVQYRLQEWLCAEFLRGADTYKNAVFQPFIPKTHNIILIFHSE